MQFYFLASQGINPQAINTLGTQRMVADESYGKDVDKGKSLDFLKKGLHAMSGITKMKPKPEHLCDRACITQALYRIKNSTYLTERLKKNVVDLEHLKSKGVNKKVCLSNRL